MSATTALDHRSTITSHRLCTCFILFPSSTPPQGLAPSIVLSGNEGPLLATCSILHLFSECFFHPLVKGPTLLRTLLYCSPLVVALAPSTAFMSLGLEEGLARLPHFSSLLTFVYFPYLFPESLFFYFHFEIILPTTLPCCCHLSTPGSLFFQEFQRQYYSYLNLNEFSILTDDPINILVSLFLELF